MGAGAKNGSSVGTIRGVHGKKFWRDLDNIVECATGSTTTLLSLHFSADKQFLCDPLSSFLGTSFHGGSHTLSSVEYKNIL